MGDLTLWWAFGAGLLIAVITTPVGVSGAVFLLPIQLDLFGVPNPQVTPTNLLFNVIAGPGALLRHRSRLRSDLTGLMLLGTVPGVAIGAILRVRYLSDPTTFRVCAALVLAPLGLYLILSAGRSRDTSPARRSRERLVPLLALAVGIAGGVYGIGGGSLLGPILVALGMPLVAVAPAALTSTFVTSIVGVGTYALLAATNHGETISPNWGIGVAAGIGGLVGGFAGARLTDVLPHTVLQRLLGVLAVGLAASYVLQVASVSS